MPKRENACRRCDLIFFGYGNRCKECARVYQANWRLANREAVNALYRANNKELIKERNRQYRAKNREVLKEKSRLYYQKSKLA